MKPDKISYHLNSDLAMTSEATLQTQRHFHNYQMFSVNAEKKFEFFFSPRIHKSNLSYLQQ